MFWGIVLEGDKKYSQKVPQAFHISMAALEIQNSPSAVRNRVHEVYVELNGQEYLLCSLIKGDDVNVFQTPLDVKFSEGTKLRFFVKGDSQDSRIHLTGYLIENLTAPSVSSSNSAIQIPIKAEQHSILVTNKKGNENSIGKKRVSIQVQEKSFDNESEDEDDEDNLNGLNQLDESDSCDDSDEEADSDDNGEIFNLDDDEDDEDGNEWTDDDSVEMEDEEEPSYIEEIVENGEEKPKGKKDKKQQPSKLNFSSDEDKSPKNSPKKDKKKGKNAVASESAVATPPSKKVKLDTSINKTPNDNGLTTPQNEKSIKTPSSVGNTPRKMLAKGGVMLTEVKIGLGVPVKNGRMAHVKYAGRLKKNNKEFDKGSIKFRLGKGEVIKGWDIAIEGMKEGGKRHAIIPPHLAYGAKGAPPDIPPNSALAFDLELLKVT